MSPRLVRRLANVYPDSGHVRDFGLATADDEAVCRRGAAEGFVIVTKDDDFRQRSFLRGSPPKIIWVRLGNCATADVEAILRVKAPEIMAFDADPAAALLVLTREPTA